MPIRTARVAFAATVLIGGAFGQVQPNEPHKIINISGRLVDPKGAPISDKTVNFRNLTIRQRLEDHPVKTDQTGMFAFHAPTHALFEINFPATDNPPIFKGIGTIEVVDGQSVDMGNIVLQFSPKHEPLIHVLGPIQFAGLQAMAVRSEDETTIAAAYTTCSAESPEFCASPTVHLIRADGKKIEPPKEKEQVGCSSVAISEDNMAVGWLVDSDFCCTSYPIQLMLVVYRPGKPIKHFTGDARAIFQWRFVAGGRQVAFYQDFLHGTPGQHYELRDVESGRLVAKWEGEITSKAPKWVQGLK